MTARRPLSPGPLISYVANDTRGHSRDNRVIRNISGDNGAGADKRSFADGHAAQNGCVATDGCAPFDPGGKALPVIGGLERAVLVDCTRVCVIDEHDSMADEYAVF